MKAADLRKSILQYAVEGKLVQQNIHDEPADILYDKIIKEKETLIKQSKIKKEKPLPPITDDEIPYNIPENWKWVRLGEVCEINKNTLKNDTNPNYSFKYIDLSAVKTGQINIPDNNIIFKNSPSRARRIIKKNDVIIATVRPNLKGFAHIDFNSEDMIVSTGFAVLTPYNIVDSKFLYHLFYTELLSFQINKAVRGTSYPAINSNDMNTLIFPLPPLKEQERIVKKVDELMALCDKLEQEEEKLLALDKHFADTLPKSILQYAVEGKLVQQDIHDEPASILYDKIIKEKESLIKQGKIKKEKPLPPITDDETPYDIPENWKWVRLGEVVSVIQGTSYNKSDITSNKKDIRIIRGGNIKHYNINILNDDIYIKQTNFNIEKQIYKNDIIIISSTGSKTILGNASFAYTDYMNTQIGAFLRIIRPYNPIFFPYLRIIFMTNYYMDYIKIYSKGIGINNIKNDTINNFPIPLPPLKEQERIVKKVDELLTYCNKLKDII